MRLRPKDDAHPKICKALLQGNFATRLSSRNLNLLPWTVERPRFTSKMCTVKAAKNSTRAGAWPPLWTGLGGAKPTDSPIPSESTPWCYHRGPCHQAFSPRQALAQSSSSQHPLLWSINTQVCLHHTNRPSDKCKNLKCKIQKAEPKRRMLSKRVGQPRRGRP